MKLKIPEEAMPVVKILRRDVPRPKTMPRREGRWNPELRWHGRCPIGIHPAAKSKEPGSIWAWPVPGVTDRNILAFVDWWDQLKSHQARAAVDLIWPPKRRKGRKAR